MGKSKQSSPIENNQRVIRVFVSSTFRDMMRERDLLVKEVFPALRRKCAQRLVTFTEVDLRWGITEEQAKEGQVLPLCLAEIERSRPYFIGLLGERYGWIPDTIGPEIIERGGGEGQSPDYSISLHFPLPECQFGPTFSGQTLRDALIQR